MNHDKSPYLCVITLVIACYAHHVQPREVAHGQDGGEAAENSIHQKLIKQLIVVVADAAADPRTMVVHSEDALAAD